MTKMTTSGLHHQHHPHNARTALYAVTGKPVAHSISPQMHNAAFEALGMDAAYVRLAAADAESALAAARSMGLAGMNVTAPYKESMAALVDRMDEEAESVGAVNTVVFEDGKAKGRNTDVYGVREALEGNGILLRGMKAVVLGAGGAAKAAARSLTSAGAEVTIANRTVDKARALARSLGCAHCGLAGQELGRAMAAASVVVSSLDTADRVIPHDVLRRSMTILEAKYDEKTALRTDALRIGCRVIDGREWLLYQGARAFRIFTHRKPPLDAMRKALYAGEGAGGPAGGNDASSGGWTGRHGEGSGIGSGWNDRQGGGNGAGGGGLAGRQGGGSGASSGGWIGGRAGGAGGTAADGRSRKNKIALIGFMGTGKTSVAGEIAKRAGCGMLDTDAEIERASGRKVADIFTRHGEAGFRRLEGIEVAKMAGMRRAVVACGGGVVTVPENARVLRETCRTVWLWADVRTIMGRLEGDGTRPLLRMASAGGRENAAKEILGSRLRQYASASDIVVSTQGRTPGAVAELILDEVGETLRH